MNGLYGDYRHTMDGKGRVSLPAKFRKVLPEALVVVPGPDASLNVFTEEGFSAWKEALFAKDGGYQVSNPRHVNLRRKYNAAAKSVEVDSAGRINIPQELRDFAHLSKDVVISGDEDHICVWDAKAWNEYMAAFDPDDIYALS